MTLAALRERGPWRAIGWFLKVLRPSLIEQRKDFGHRRRGSNRRSGRVDLSRAKVANAAVVELDLVVAVISRDERRGILMLVVSEVGGDLGLLKGAIRRSRREGKLKGQQEEEE